MGERGQATTEWVGLVLGLALAFGGALTFAHGADFGAQAHGLGEGLSGRMTCAVRGACRAGAAAAPGVPLAPRPPAPRPPAPRPLALRPPGRGVPPAPSATGTGRRVLRSLARAGEHAWVVCFGVRRLRQDLDHPRSPRQALSPGEALDVVNDCLNPLGFLLP